MTRLQELRAKALQIEDERPVRPDLWIATKEEAFTYYDAYKIWSGKSNAAFEVIRKELTV